MTLVFLIFSFKPAFSLSSFTLIKRLFSSSSLSAIRVIPSTYLRLLIFLPAIFFFFSPGSLDFQLVTPPAHVMCSAYKLNKQGDNKQPYTPFSILNQSVVPYKVPTIATWLAYRFFRRQVKWSGIPISLRVSHSLLWSTKFTSGYLSKEILIPIPKKGSTNEYSNYRTIALISHASKVILKILHDRIREPRTSRCTSLI